MPKIGRHNKDVPITKRASGGPTTKNGINFYHGKPRKLIDPKDRPKNGPVKIIVPAKNSTTRESKG